MKALERVKVPSYSDFRQEWIGWALANSDVTPFFTSPPEATPYARSLCEIYRETEILRVAKGKKTTYEVSGDFSAEVGSKARSVQDNSDLEDALRAEAAAAKVKVVWSSEADNFVAITNDVEAARWVVDRLVQKRRVAAS